MNKFIHNVGRWSMLIGKGKSRGGLKGSGFQGWGCFEQGESDKSVSLFLSLLSLSIYTLQSSSFPTQHI
jgi:hypothetical protein